MAQTNFTPISLYYSATAAAVPTAGNLVAGELAINTADGKLFYKDSAGVVQVIGTKGGVGTSSTTQVLYNSSGLVVGSANMTFNGTTLTLANDASISGLVVGKGNSAVGSNTAVGFSALASNTSGAENTAFGRNALVFNTTGAGNSAFGFNNLYTNVDGALNSAFGDATLFANTSGNNNSGFGFNALRYNTTGTNNSAFGMYALNANTTASNNTAVGYQAGYSNTTGTGFTALGYQAGYSNTANFVTAVGQSALYTNTGAGNTAFGRVAGYSVTSGTYNTILGHQAGYALTTGSFNTFVGAQNSVGEGCGGSITTGTKNTILGGFSGNAGGLDIRTASNNVVLSDGDGVWNYRATNSIVEISADEGNIAAASSIRFRTDGSEKIRIDLDGNLLVGTTTSYAPITATVASNGAMLSLDRTSNIDATLRDMVQFRRSVTSVGSITCSNTLTSYNTTSDYRLKNVIAPVTNAGERLDLLEPIEYEWKSTGGNTKGFLAHQFAEVYPNSVSGEKDAVDDEGNPVYQAMQASTPEVMADLIAEIQSLRKRVALLESK